MSCYAKEILKGTVHVWYETLLFFFTNKNEVDYDTNVHEGISFVIFTNMVSLRLAFE